MFDRKSFLDCITLQVTRANRSALHQSVKPSKALPYSFNTLIGYSQRRVQHVVLFTCATQWVIYRGAIWTEPPHSSNKNGITYEFRHLNLAGKLSKQGHSDVQVWTASLFRLQRVVSQCCKWPTQKPASVSACISIPSVIKCARAHEKDVYLMNLWRLKRRIKHRY